MAFPFMATSLAVLFFGGLMIYILRNKIGENAGKIAVAVAGIAAALMVPAFYEVIIQGGYAFESLRWSLILGEFGLYLDGIAFPITFSVVVLGFLSVVYAVGYTSHTKNKPNNRLLRPLG